MQHSQSAVFTGHSYSLAAGCRSQNDPVIAAFKRHLLAGQLLGYTLQRSDPVGQRAGIPVSEGLIAERPDYSYFGQLLRVERKCSFLIFEQNNGLLSCFERQLAMFFAENNRVIDSCIRIAFLGIEFTETEPHTESIE
ncbi:hypothetical protein D3C74_398580 [compost metagenome]